MSVRRGGQSNHLILMSYHTWSLPLMFVLDWAFPPSIHQLRTVSGPSGRDEADGPDRWEKTVQPHPGRLKYRRLINRLALVRDL